jgi:hypothetical protein
MSSPGNYVNQNVALERRNTALIVQLYGLPVQLNRPKQMQRTAAGGVARTGLTMSFPARRRWISTQGRETYEQESVVGSSAKLKHYILSDYDDDIQRGDWFINPIDGRKFTIQYVHEDKTVETRADIEPVQ